MYDVEWIVAHDPAHPKLPLILFVKQWKLHEALHGISKIEMTMGAVTPSACHANAMAKFLVLGSQVMHNDFFSAHMRQMAVVQKENSHRVSRVQPFDWSN